MTEQYVENLIVGASLSGAIVSWILSRQGYDGVLLEKQNQPGGMNGSFFDEQGNRFDYGRHCLYMHRSEFAERFFAELLDGEVNRIPVSRGIVVRGQIIPYATPLEEWPQALQSLFTLDTNRRVHLGSTREEFATAYGRQWADLVFDDMVRSYPSLQWQKENGKPEEQLLDWLFPWFFPHSPIESIPDPEQFPWVYSFESIRFHLSMRAPGAVEEVMYPKQGGHKTWIETMLDKSPRIDRKMGVGNVEIQLDPDSLQVRHVHADGTTYIPDRVFWCTPVPNFCRAAGWELPPGEPQELLLGSFAFDRPVTARHAEILIADPDHSMDRISYPELFAGHSSTRTLQVERMGPVRGMTATAEAWRDSWLTGLKQLGIVTDEHTLENFNFKRVPAGFLTTSDLNEVRSRIQARLKQSTTNVVIPYYTVAPDNNSRIIPGVFQNIYQKLTTDNAVAAT